MRWTRTSTTRQPTLSVLFTKRDNAFGVLRLTLALMVILSHSFILSGNLREPIGVLTHGQTTFGDLAVGGFFVISGFLITGSGLGNDVVQFMWKRVLRIFPAYWLVLLLTAFVIAPLVYLHETGGLDGFWLQKPGPVTYPTTNWFLNVRQWGIGNLLINTPYGQLTHSSVFNGSIWTLVYEFRCYLAVAVLAVIGVLRHVKFIVPLIALGIGIVTLFTVYRPELQPQLYAIMGDIQMMHLSLLFALGASFCLYADKIPLSNVIGTMAVVLWLGTLQFGLFYPIGCVAFAYVLLWAAAVLPGVFRKVGREHDISYGVYIYGFLVAQLLAEFGFLRFGWLPYVLTSMVLACICGALSWHLIERPALSLKSRGPGRGIRWWHDWWSGTEDVEVNKAAT